MSPTPVMGTPSTMGDDSQLTTTRLLLDAARSHGDQMIAYRDEHDEWHETTYREVTRRALSITAALQKLGFGPGHQVATMLWNDLYHFESYFSIPASGATMVLINLRFRPDELAYVINHAQAEAIIVDAMFLPRVAEVKDETPGLREAIVVGVFDRAEAKAALPGVRIHAYEELVEDTEPADPKDLPAMDERSASGACFTTGTTGKPKGVFYSHRSVWLHAASMATQIAVSARTRMLLLTPMFHVQCWGVPYTAVMVGSVVLLPGRVHAAGMGDLARAAERYGATFAPAAPALLFPMLHAMEDMEKAPDLSGMELICGASTPPLSLIERFHDVCGGEVIHAYGATETSPLVAINRTADHLTEGLSDEEILELQVSPGSPAAGVDAKVVDDDGNELPWDGESTGELCFRGAWIASSYHDDEEASATSFDEEGYWRSGDVGYFDKNGLMYITDRLKDVIKSGGEWISSIELEGSITHVPGVAAAAVIGIPHPHWEERPLALVEARPGRDVSPEDVTAHLAKKFPQWQLPDDVLIVEEIARTSVGKMNKKALREEYHNHYGADDQEPF